MIDMLIQNFLV